MRSAFVILIVLIALKLSAKEGRFQNISRHGYKDFQYGVIYPGLTKVNQYFLFEYQDQFSPAIRTIGVSDKAIYKVFGRWLFDGLLTGNYFLTEKVNSGDSISYNLNGYSISVNYGKDLLPQILEVDVNFYLGAGFQQLRMLGSYLGEEVLYKHPSITTNGIVECRVNMKKPGKKNGFSFGIRGGILFDVWQKGWHTKTSNAEDIPDLSNINIIAQGMVSWLL